MHTCAGFFLTLGAGVKSDASVAEGNLSLDHTTAAADAQLKNPSTDDCPSFFFFWADDCPSLDARSIENYCSYSRLIRWVWRGKRRKKGWFVLKILFAHIILGIDVAHCNETIVRHHRRMWGRWSFQASSTLCPVAAFKADPDHLQVQLTPSTET